VAKEQTENGIVEYFVDGQGPTCPFANVVGSQAALPSSLTPRPTRRGIAFYGLDVNPPFRRCQAKRIKKQTGAESRTQVRAAGGGRRSSTLRTAAYNHLHGGNTKSSPVIE
jgi:hypothetical protein